MSRSFFPMFILVVLQCQVLHLSKINICQIIYMSKYVHVVYT